MAATVHKVFINIRMNGIFSLVKRQLSKKRLKKRREDERLFLLKSTKKAHVQHAIEHKFN